MPCGGATIRLRTVATLRGSHHSTPSNASARDAGALCVATFTSRAAMKAYRSSRLYTTKRPESFRAGGPMRCAFQLRSVAGAIPRNAAASLVRRCRPTGGMYDRTAADSVRDTSTPSRRMQDVSRSMMPESAFRGRVSSPTIEGALVTSQDAHRSSLTLGAGKMTRGAGCGDLGPMEECPCIIASDAKALPGR